MGKHQYIYEKLNLFNYLFYELDVLFQRLSLSLQ